MYRANPASALGDAVVPFHPNGLGAPWRRHRPLEASERSDGTLRYLCLAAALLTPRPPELLALNEPETTRLRPASVRTFHDGPRGVSGISEMRPLPAQSLSIERDESRPATPSQGGSPAVVLGASRRGGRPRRRALRATVGGMRACSGTLVAKLGALYHEGPASRSVSDGRSDGASIRGRGTRRSSPT
jgi:hypothetical protein